MREKGYVFIARNDGRFRYCRIQQWQAFLDREINAEELFGNASPISHQTKILSIYLDHSGMRRNTFLNGRRYQVVALDTEKRALSNRQSNRLPQQQELDLTAFRNQFSDAGNCANAMLDTYIVELLA